MKRLTAALLMLAAALVADLTAAKLKSRVDFDKSFDFKGVQTWSWDAAGPGEVKLARSSEDDPEAVRRRIEPTLVASVEKEMAGAGLKKAAASAVPDVRVHYYVLVSVGFATQTVGQFLPTVTQWGIPPYVPATSSFDIVQRGAIVLDLVATKVSHVVWRGIAEGDIDKIKDDNERDEMIRDGIKDLVKKVPRK